MGLDRPTARGLLDAATPPSGAAAMGTGIVSVALALEGRELVSRVLLGVGAALWAALAVVVVLRALRAPGRLRAEARSPAALTGVAATAVLGTRVALLGWKPVSAALLAVALGALLALLGPVLRHWRTPASGASLMLSVALQSLAVLAAGVATREHAPWLAYSALGPFAAGLAAYPAVMARFDWRELRRGRGDHWIAGGALAICALAAAQLALAQVALAGPDVLRRALADGSAALWGATICWVLILIAGEALHRRLAYDVRRWSTVFPLGMVAVCSFKTAAAVHAEAIRSFALAWTWVALAGWAAVAAGSLGRLLAAARRPEGAAREQI